MTASGRQPGKGASLYNIKLAVQSLGFKVRVWDWKEIRALIDSYPGAGPGLKNITTHHPRRYPQVWARLDNVLLITKSHIAAYRDGALHDWSVNNALRVQHVWSVEPA